MKLFAAAPLAVALLAPAAGSLEVSAVSVGHICSAERIYVANKGPRRIAFMPGIGTGGFAVRTTSPEAQRWFDYGIQLYHAFYHADARLAFDKAVAADPGCALCLWGQALSRGPTMNFDVDAADSKAGLDMARKALAASRPEEERRLSRAMIDRYQGDQKAAATEQRFAAALLAAAGKDPAATDIRLIAAHALMTAGRRGDQNAAMGVEARSLILPILKAQPDNTAAIHYYIHATEFAGDPADALPYAERLAALAPGASHLIHMASHTYIHVGRYEDVAALNARALEVDAAHARATDAPGVLGSPDYYPHNLSFGMAGAMMAGDGTLAVRFADDAKAAFPPGGRAEMLQGRAADAARTFAAAAQLQEGAKWGMDPPPFWYPVRRSVAAAELKAGRDADALRQADASLRTWPGDALALQVRALAERKLGQTARSEADEAASRAAWHGIAGGEPIDLI